MTVTPIIDHGQELATPVGQAIGFVDTKVQFDAVTPIMHGGKRSLHHHIDIGP